MMQVLITELGLVYIAGYHFVMNDDEWRESYIVAVFNHHSFAHYSCHDSVIATISGWAMQFLCLCSLFWRLRRKVCLCPYEVLICLLWF